METQGFRRFVDRATFVRQAKLFAHRKHYKLVYLLFGVYCLSFFIVSWIAFFFAANHFVIIGAFLVFFGGACLINYLYINKMNDMNNAVEFQNAIFSSALRDKYDFCLVFDNRGNLVYVDEGFAKEFVNDSNIYSLSVEEILKIMRFNMVQRKKKFWT